MWYLIATIVAVVLAGRAIRAYNNGKKEAQKPFGDLSKEKLRLIVEQSVVSYAQLSADYMMVLEQLEAYKQLDRDNRYIQVVLAHRQDLEHMN